MEYRLSNSNVTGIHVEDLYNYSVKSRSSIWTRFLSWCEAQNSDRFLWLALSFFAQIGLTLPITAVMIVFFGDNSLLLWILVAAVNIPVLVLNLAAMPTKITLPFVFFGWLTQAIVIMYCVAFALLH